MHRAALPWRTEITRRLILEKNASFITVEGDWPTWMWANQEIAVLAQWLREHNRSRLAEKQVGFYGLDIYSLWDSMEAAVRYRASVEYARRPAL